MGREKDRDVFCAMQKMPSGCGQKSDRNMRIAATWALLGVLAGLWAITSGINRRRRAGARVTGVEACKVQHSDAAAHAHVCCSGEALPFTQVVQRGQPLRAQGEDEISIVSYNILADMFAKAHRLPHVHPDHLQWERRLALILEELTRLDADVCCLQEVDASWCVGPPIVTHTIADSDPRIPLSKLG